MPDITGNQVLLVTPFDAEGKLDADSMADLVDFVLAGGADGVIAHGTTGEFFTLTPAERVESMRHLVKLVGGRASVTVGVGATGTAEAAELARQAQEVGADCVMVLPPLYFALSPAAQVIHFRRVAQAVDLPAMLYDGAGGIPVSAEVVAHLSAVAANVRYVKLALPDPGRVSEVMARAPHVVPLAGDDTSLLGALRQGARSSAVATANIQPSVMSNLLEAHGRGEAQRAAALFCEQIAPSVLATSTPKTEFIARFKVVLAAMGVIRTPLVRAPLQAVNDADADELLDVMRRLGIV